MLFTLILENSSGDRIDMTTTANQYMIFKISGQHIKLRRHGRHTSRVDVQRAVFRADFSFPFRRPDVSLTFGEWCGIMLENELA